MPRTIAGVVAGLVAWILIATIGNLGLRVAWPGYSEVEPAMRFTDAMMAARLVLGPCLLLGRDSSSGGSPIAMVGRSGLSSRSC